MVVDELTNIPFVTVMTLPIQNVRRLPDMKIEDQCQNVRETFESVGNLDIIPLREFLR